MRTRTRIALAGLALGAVMVGGVAWATIPADTVYTACKLKATGTIRLIDPAGPSNSLLSRCTTFETQITWNQKGPAGEPGAPGAKGADGTNGANGAPGAAGAPGAKGDPGSGFTWRGVFEDDGAYNAGDVVSFEGAAWITNVAIPRAGEPPSGSWQLLAAQGAPGTNGTDGAPGATGPQGPQGATGAQGATGSTGATGPQGLTGQQGAAGAAGGVSGYQIVSSADKTIPAISSDDTFVACPAGKVVIGGGVRTGLNDWFADGQVADSHPKDNGWYARVFNPDINLFVGLHFMAFAICANG